MKNFAVMALALLVSSQTFAAERAFRVDRDSSLVSGYAIAVGVKGKSVDFEKFDAAGEKGFMDFDAKYNTDIRNYLVDLETNQILADLTSAGGENSQVVYWIGDMRMGNHFGLELQRIDLDGIPMNAEALVVIENSKWGNGHGEVIVVNREAGKSKILSKSKESLHDAIMIGLKKRMTALDYEKLQNFALTMKIAKEVNADGTTNLSIEGVVPKEDGEITLTAKAGFRLFNNEIVVDISDLKKKK